MKIIISPAKKMNINTDFLEPAALPVFLEEAGLLMKELQKLTFTEAKELWQCNEKLAQLNYERFAHMNLKRALTPAILSYEGLQYQHMAPEVFTDAEFAYIQEHLRILSGFYGVLAPLDGITPYRLEMQARLHVNGCKDLYEFWGDRLYEKLTEDDETIINLASKEYSQCIEKYVTAKDTFITVEFGELIEGKVRQKGTFAKMARGEMVRFMAENNITEPKRIKEFSCMGLVFSEELSNANRYIFISNG